jgi:chemotaxis protein MotB
MARGERRLRRRGGEDEGPNHDRWLVSYADFITLLFAFFVVMYAISQINEGKYRVLSDSLLKAFRPDGQGERTIVPPLHPHQAPSGNGVVPPIRPDGKGEAGRSYDRMRTLARDVMNALDPMVKSGQVRVTESGRGLEVELNASVLFTAGEAELQTQAQPALDALARVLAPLPNDIEIEGHTDNLPIATPRYPSNWELSSARASSVVRLMIERGVASVRLVAVGYAETRNISSNATPEGRAQNRRVTILILPEGTRQSRAVSSPPAGDPVTRP